MTAAVADIPASRAEVEFAPEPDASFLGLFTDSHRYHYLIAP